MHSTASVALVLSHNWMSCTDALAAKLGSEMHEDNGPKVRSGMSESVGLEEVVLGGRPTGVRVVMFMIRSGIEGEGVMMSGCSLKVFGRGSC